MPVRYLLIDCDPGVDDALALILAFAGADVRAPAVTTVAGNAPVHICTRNALRVQAIACPKDAPPVHQGAAGPLSGIERERALHVHGADNPFGADVPQNHLALRSDADQDVPQN